MKYYGKNAESVEKLLKTDFAQGLSDKEAKRRLRHYGMNNIFETGKRTPSKVLYGLIYDPVSIILLVSALVCFSYSSFISAVIIISVWIVNNFITIVAYYKAESIFHTIKNYGIPKVKILRQSKVYMVDSRLLVPGDVVIIEAGDIICADCKILKADNLLAYENDLCGTNEPRQKFVCDDEDAITLSDMHGMLFASSSIVSGYGVAVVVATGANTEIVSSAGMIPLSGKHTPEIFSEVKKKCRTWGLFSTLIVTTLFVVKILIDPTDIFGSFMIIVALLGASMTESLLPLTQIVCARNIAHNAQFSGHGRSIVKNLGAIEDLRELSYLVITDEITQTEDDILTIARSAPMRIFVCSPRREAFALATRLGAPISANTEECLHTTEKFTVYVAEGINDRLDLIQALKKKGRVGALTNKLDSIRMLSSADVAFTYGRFKYKTSGMTKIVLEGIKSTHNQILSRVSDVICEETINSVSRASTCASRIYSCISSASVYLMTAHFIRVILSAVSMFSGIRFIDFSDILISGMIVDLVAVFSLCMNDGIKDTGASVFSRGLLRPVICSTLVSAFLILLSYIACSIPVLSSLYQPRAAVFAALLIYPVSFIFKTTNNRSKNDKLILVFCIFIVLCILTMLILISGLQQMFGIQMTVVSVGAAFISISLSELIIYAVSKYYTKEVE